ncbi:ATP-dependent DNA helicase [Marinitoga sp. 1154]|uniref:RNA-binding domain-containing protein n=1 Tax=Marinitoga sp. 1154 TaxID=1643335 RepID=UPI001586A38C|nr:RNA-binding domain-containing protein [Marinitoga sp. 1154]NUV00471.1 ATP-dependent DNA helicase [Marinitoga sp. 1154]
MILYEIRKGENKKLELKEKIPSNEAIAKTVVAFSNTSGGKLIIGVKDNKEIIGIEEDKIFEYEEKISSIINDLCYPTILPEIYAQNIEGKVVLVIEIFRGSLLPYYLKSKGKLKGTYVRIGSTNRVADEEMIVELQRQRFNKSFDEEINFEIDIKDIDLNIIYDEFKKIGKKCDYDKLRNLKLIKKVNGKDLPTNALLIALGKFDNTMIKCARFKGVTKEIFIDKKEFDKSLFYNLENSIKFLQNHLNLNAEVKGLQLKEDFEIPILALREVLINAVIHRNYLRNSDIKIAVYDDIVEIVSPGGFPNGLTIEEVMNGRSEIRNKILANLFRELKYVETWGSGIEKIKKLCREKNIKFEIKESGNFVSVIFYRPKIKRSKKTLSSSEKPAKNQRKTSEKPAKNQRKTSEKIDLTNQEEIVYNFVIKNKKINLKIVENILNVKSARAREILKNLTKKGVLEKIGKTKGSFYILKLRDEE